MVGPRWFAENFFGDMDLSSFCALYNLWRSCPRDSPRNELDILATDFWRTKELGALPVDPPGLPNGTPVGEIDPATHPEGPKWLTYLLEKNDDNSKRMVNAGAYHKNLLHHGAFYP